MPPHSTPLNSYTPESWNRASRRKQSNDSQLRNNESIEIKPLNCRKSQSALPFFRQKGIHSKIFLQEVQPLRRYSLHDELGREKLCWWGY